MRAVPITPRRAWMLAAACTLLLSSGQAAIRATAWNAQPDASPALFTTAFPAEEFAARRTRLLAAIGDGAAVLQGATETAGYVKFRQGNQFFYLTGVEVPRAIVILDGRAKTTTLFVPPRDERREKSEGPLLTPGEDAVRLTGVDRVLPRDEFAAALTALGEAGRTLYLPHRPEALGAATPGRVEAHAKASLEDPWDGRVSREAAFLGKVKAQAPRAAIKDLDPLLDAMRLVKSPREIAAIREATRIAGLAIMEAMRRARPGQYEYELEAIGDFVFKQHNAYGPAYFGLVASGTNAFWPHYHAAQRQIADGDFVLYDYAPDYHYYTSDVTRMFPINGRFSPDQRELYGVYARLYQALMAAIRPRATPREIRADAVAGMKRILAETTFAQAKHREAAEAFVAKLADGENDPLGHWVGMEVHDVDAPFERYAPGMVFTIEPPITVPADRTYVRLEDVILITETGYENLSAFVPMEIDAVEALMQEGRTAPTDSRSRR